MTVGITSGASAPERLVTRACDWFRARGVERIEPYRMVDEDVTFRLPVELRRELALADAPTPTSNAAALRRRPATDDPPTLRRCLDARRRGERAARRGDRGHDAARLPARRPRGTTARAGRRGTSSSSSTPTSSSHPDAFARIRAAFAGDRDLVAVFGSYDDRVVTTGVVAGFRNLLHHTVHQRSAGEAGSFWAGPRRGARATRSPRSSGFDARRYPRPSIEDVELGGRLAERGRLVLDPALQGTHLKEWTLGSMVVTDFARRGVPWVALMADRGERSRDPQPRPARAGERRRRARGRGRAAAAADARPPSPRLAAGRRAQRATSTALIAQPARERAASPPPSPSTFSTSSSAIAAVPAGLRRVAQATRLDDVEAVEGVERACPPRGTRRPRSPTRRRGSAPSSRFERAEHRGPHRVVLVVVPVEPVAADRLEVLDGVERARGDDRRRPGSRRRTSGTRAAPGSPCPRRRASGSSRPMRPSSRAASCDERVVRGVPQLVPGEAEVLDAEAGEARPRHPRAPRAEVLDADRRASRGRGGRSSCRGTARGRWTRARRRSGRGSGAAGPRRRRRPAAAGRATRTSSRERDARDDAVDRDLALAVRPRDDDRRSPARRRGGAGSRGCPSSTGTPARSRSSASVSHICPGPRRG